MLAMVLREPAAVEQSPLKPEDLPAPAPGPGEIRLAVSCCGVCHTDLHVVEGELKLPRLPIVPGHQIVGHVDARGTGVRKFREGDLVGIPWLHSSDQSCEFCLRGLENLCAQGRFTGLDVNGGYAEQALVHEDFAYSMPVGFTDEHAAPLLCAGVIGYRALRLAGVQQGQALGLFGFGGSAHLVLQVARARGCEVFVFTRAAHHRELAMQLGAAWAGDAADQAPRELHAAIIFAPAGALVPHALKALRKAGTLVLAGISMTTIPAMDYELLYQERVIRSVANATRQDCREFLEIAAEAGVHTEVEVFPLARANEALQALKHSKVAASAVLKVKAN
jgi:propanol-preferring alcohol dehydrogenase